MVSVLVRADPADLWVKGKKGGNQKEQWEKGSGVAHKHA